MGWPLAPVKKNDPKFDMALRTDWQLAQPKATPSSQCAKPKNLSRYTGGKSATGGIFEVIYLFPPVVVLKTTRLSHRHRENPLNPAGTTRRDIKFPVLVLPSSVQKKRELFIHQMT
jgi:hypothetical protein